MNACFTRTFILTASFVLLFNSPASAQQWPQFLGPDASMIVEEGNPPDTWSESENIAWTHAMGGESWSSPVIWDQQVFITWAEVVNDPQVQKAEGDVGGRVYSWQVACLDLERGKELWSAEARRGYPRMKKHAASNYASETPLTDGERLYVYFGMHGLYCYSLDGQLLWSRDLGAYHTQLGWGTGSSPLMDGERIFIQVDNHESSFLVALDKRSGEEVWRVDRDEHTTYSTPYLWQNRLRSELVVGGQIIRSYLPETGQLLWELEGKGKNTIPTAKGDPDRLYVGNVKYLKTPATLFCVKAGAKGDISPAEGDSISDGVIWSYADAPLGNPTPLLYKGLLYVVGNRKGLVHILDAADGSLVQRLKFSGTGEVWSSPWAHQDKVFFTDGKGTTTVFKAGEDFAPLHQNKLDDKIWSSVAASGDNYLIKGLDRLYCIRQ